MNGFPGPSTNPLDEDGWMRHEQIVQDERNCLSWWFPRIHEAGLNVPETRIVRVPEECCLDDLIDGREPKGYQQFITSLVRSISEVGGPPAFMRTGRSSFKHDWHDTCDVRTLDRMQLMRHVARIVDLSCSATIIGLPVDVWAIRERLRVCAPFRAFHSMPITREFRFFVREGALEHMQPYWPPDAISFRWCEPPGWWWRNELAKMSVLADDECEALSDLAIHAVRAVGGGYWSVDFLEADDGWYLIDMALGDVSFEYDPELNNTPHAIEGAGTRPAVIPGTRAGCAPWMAPPARTNKRCSV